MTTVRGAGDAPARVEWDDATDLAGLDEAALAALWPLDLAEAPEDAAGVTVDDALLQPPAAHAARPIDLGAVTAALQRVAARPARPGQPPAESRMREVAARYLDLRLEVAAGMGRISVG